MCRGLWLAIVAALIVGVASTAWPQALTLQVQQTGLLQLRLGGTEVAIIELNAHGPQWKHAGQEGAAGQVTDVQGGKRVTGSLPIPNIEGAAIVFTETITAKPQGLSVEYDVAPNQAMRLNGLQVSVLLPLAHWEGKDLVLTQGDGSTRTVRLSGEPPIAGYTGEAARVEAGKGAPGALTLELKAAADVMVQDLRPWERPFVEIRFPALMEDQGTEVASEDRFHLDLSVLADTAIGIQ